MTAREREGDHATEAVAHDDGGLVPDDRRQIIDLGVEGRGRAGGERLAVPPTVVPDHPQVAELACDAQEGRAAIQGAVHEDDADGSLRSAVLSDEEVGHGGAR